MLIFDSAETRAYWREACAASGIDPATPYHAGTFGEPTTPDRAAFMDVLSALARDGDKRGTTHTQHHFEQDNIRLREPGDCWVVTTVAGEPLCVVRITEVEIMPFDQVGEGFAASEGEGDLSLEYWRDAHLRYFKAQCRNWGQAWRENPAVVCESFELVYRP